jgi:hypothetical protein
MFYALALVCDHYFVPSLDVIIGRLSAINNEKRIEERYRTSRLYTYYYGGWFIRRIGVPTHHIKLTISLPLSSMSCGFSRFWAGGY